MFLAVNGKFLACAWPEICICPARDFSSSLLTEAQHAVNRGAALRRVVSPGMERVTSQNPQRSFPSTDHGTILFDSLYEVIAARGFVTAVFPEERADAQLIKPNAADEYECRQRCQPLDNNHGAPLVPGFGGSRRRISRRVALTSDSW